MAEQGEVDLAVARRKAAKRLGIGNRRLWPDSEQMEMALREHQALFLGHRQPAELQRLRQLALELMDLLEPFHPRLTGMVLTGLADIHSPVELHLFSDRSEDILLHLLELGLRPVSGERIYRYPDGSEASRPLFRLEQQNPVAELSCFPSGELAGRSPLEPLGNGLQQRISRRAFEQLISAPD